jgi:hypothetical protein
MSCLRIGIEKTYDVLWQSWTESDTTEFVSFPLVALEQLLHSVLDEAEVKRDPQPILYNNAIRFFSF